jgi:hypothetical protein
LQIGHAVSTDGLHDIGFNGTKWHDELRSLFTKN